VNSTGTILGREPALIAGAIDAVINLLIAFHVVALSGDQIAQINVALAAIFALIVRQAVTPTASPRLRVGTRVMTPTGAPAVVSGAARTVADPCQPPSGACRDGLSCDQSR
jgi:hypothetical protein